MKLTETAFATLLGISGCHAAPDFSSMPSHSEAKQLMPRRHVGATFVSALRQENFDGLLTKIEETLNQAEPQRG